jgi:hypothetical protein
MTLQPILDKFLPYAPEELRCGMKKKAKTEARMKLLAQLNFYIDGRIDEESPLAYYLKNAPPLDENIKEYLDRKLKRA